MKGVCFDKKKSRPRAKFVIIILLIITIGSCIHHPLYRSLIDERNNNDDLDPFLIDPITKKSRQQSIIHKQ
jgi:hypothetical protein